MRRTLLIGLLATVALSGCASVEVARIKRPMPDASAEILVYRESVVSQR